MRNVPHKDICGRRMQRNSSSFFGKAKTTGLFSDPENLDDFKNLTKIINK